jgi:uncharacterized protein YjbI with pentapeptide repeats
MQTRNLTPFPFGTKVTARTPPQLEMTLVLRGLFTLAPGQPVAPVEAETGFAQGFLTADVYPPDDDERRGECLYPSDFADWKRSAEVLLRGTCHAPGGRPVAECPVELTVGTWSKRLRVVGRRVWTESLVGNPISSPAPFVQMPLSYASAFGGPEHRANPVGKGWKTPELPTVELPDKPIRSRADQPPPASFAPVNPAWAPRAGKVGKDYGKKYQAERAPFYAEDFDWSYFHAAPADQVLPGYLRGDEVLGFTNLHPATPAFQVTLPALRVRAFVKDTSGAVREVTMNLDTLFASVDEGTLALTWRGLCRVADRELRDVTQVVVASEPLASEPLPVEHYLAIFAEMKEDPYGLRRALPPQEAELALGMMKQGKGGLGPGSAGAPDPSLDPISAQLARSLGPVAPETQGRVRASIAGMVERERLHGPARPGLDLHAQIAAALAAGAGGAYLPAAALRPGQPPRVPLKDPILRMRQAVANVEQSDPGPGGHPPELAALSAKANDPALARLDPRLGALPPAGAPPVEPGPGRDLRGRDFSGQDLSGKDLSGATLEGATLTGANLRGANLSGCNLQYAVLATADLTGADLSRADLTMANLSKVSAAGVDLSGAVLDQAVLTEANLERAVLRGARGEQTILSGANLTEAVGEECHFLQAIAAKAVLNRARFARARLERCAFLEIQASGIDLTQADLTRSSFAGATLDRAVAVEARGEATVWIGARLDYADLSHARLPRAHFSEGSLLYTRFCAADLEEARFYRASLDHTELGQARLFGADLCRATLTGARFVGANLYDAKLLDAVVSGCDFTGANLRASTLERA